MRTSSIWAVACVAVVFACTPKKDKPNEVTSAQGAATTAGHPPKPVGKLQISSSAFSAGGKIPKKYTCEGGDTQPPLAFGGVPGAAKSLVLFVDDPDAPSKTWVHWVVYNLPPSTTALAEAAALPAGAATGKNDFQKTSYGGPCPPSGRHRYFFKLYALDVKLDGVGDATQAEVSKAMQGHVLARGQFMATYQKGD